VTLADIAAIALAAWVLTYHLCFGPLCEGFRKRVGIAYDLDAQGRACDRWGVNRVATFLNCPTCTALLATAIVAVVWYTIRGLVWWLAVIGLATLIARWWVSQRVKAEWWR
jgi:Flp pilus assembly protein TadB